MGKQTRVGIKSIIITTALLLTASTLTPSVAHADLLKGWVGARGNYFSGESDVFLEFDQPFGGGLDAGLELLGVTFFAEAMSMIPKSGALPDQWLFTGNLGVDFTFGDTVRFHIGAYTGPILFLFPEGEPPAGVDFSQLSPESQMLLMQAEQFGGDIEQAEMEFNQFSEKEADLARTAFGWNLGRARLALDVKFAKIFAIGVQGQVGYHYIISGEEAAAGAKNEAINQFVAQNNLPESIGDELKAVVGANPVDPDSLNGINYDASLFFRIEFGTGGSSPEPIDPAAAPDPGPTRR